MGLMSKLNKMKSFLFDEEDDEKEEKKVIKKPIKKQDEREEIKKEYKPKEIKKEEEFYFEDISEDVIPSKTEVHSRVEKKESQFNFPEFNDEDFMVAKKKPEPIIPVKKEEPKRVLYQGSKRKEETKKFKPSPIISPIYGLLDKDGNHINEEKPKDKTPNYNDEITFDAVRKKAYGTLDEEIENTMKRLSKKTIEEAEKDMEDENKKELSRSQKKSAKVVEEKPSIVSITDDDDDDDDMILPNVNFKEIDVDKKIKSSKKVNNKKEVKVSDDDDDDDDTKEQDLFNLIDTMYQNKEDED